VSIKSEMSLGKVLVIDDQEVVARYIADNLTESVPCNATYTKNPKDAVGGRHGEKFDLVITDLRMPGLDGLAVLAEVKALAPRCEVIVLTVRASLQSAIDAMKLGAVEYIGREEDEDSYLDNTIAAVRKALLYRPSERAPGFHRENLILFLLERLGKSTVTRKESFGQLPAGLALEYAVKLLLETCSGFETTWHRFRTANEENDIVCLNQSNHPFWDRQGLVILVECKDYGKKKPGDNERGRLERKIRSRQGQSTVGIFVSPSGFAKTFLTPKDITPVPGGPPPVIIPIDEEALWAWVASYDRLAWLTDRAVASVF
jgi:CheY-like chemotaxis protein